ncbi:PEP-CTERM sorting domain-containing protein [Chamaesiphon minutus]|uniref:PEP-CTERM putative exosortase interaction domain-containing protein n=1 Tax=Chamaesiphon minutus (strain ATCC 27169 / PCC 6605) TaxID=1173020 RepID=K9UHR5_CHAP6|nr:PEP-CTERM sorting domain-containing protein [Chamaesiphon minutus]AFY93744.1 PEP-CTERM putative exosortase interaction domain-containing protein [Chamaesiphon minutus PCC 6605]
MNKFSTSLTYAAVASTISLGAFGVTPAHAVGFSGAYDPANFTLSNTIGSTGSVDTASAPGSITLFGSDSGSSVPGSTDYTIAAAASGTFSFNWAYDTIDEPEFDPFSVLINGVATQLSDNTGTPFQSSLFSTSVNLGDTIGWRINTTDNNFGAAQVTISNFSAPEVTATEVPEPFTIIGTCIGGAAALRMRKKLTSKS